MWEAIVHDARLSGTCPDGEFTVITVDQSTPLESMVRDVRSCSIRHGGELRLRIYAHGLTQDGHGGFGLQVCHEGINLGTVEHLNEWAGMIPYGIDIYCCSAAERAPGHGGIHGDGRLLCSEIARTTLSVVRAAMATQYYHAHEGLNGLFRRPIDFGGWEGYVVTYGPSGGMIDMQLNPER